MAARYVAVIYRVCYTPAIVEFHLPVAGSHPVGGHFFWGVDHLAVGPTMAATLPIAVLRALASRRQLQRRQTMEEALQVFVEDQRPATQFLRGEAFFSER